ncbi:glycosyl transferase [Sphingobacterium yanglingense]|uniref:Glycosyl transferase n=1 Tax=Sphingobacterium yanglingense TaxID=1437280 RepID=A0A4R6WL97_9SPHI|nr:glycosyl transferase [Sphingobacterium yanglingense]TDQ76641.1 hypothetical protein CLV99_3234 [Sphingobacterium yanglingense]
MKNNFCTLFNSVYLTRGIAMYRSLEQYCPDFHLYIYAFDDACYTVLTAMDLSKVTVLRLDDFEDEELLSVKLTRTPGEYCWTCTPAVILHAIETYGLEACTYLDADLLFFSNPSTLLEEMGNASVLITPHRYTPEYDQSATSGIYCVQFVCFKNTDEGMKVLRWWRSACLEWCYNRLEEGRFGDQKYLDDWCTRFSGVHELIHLGGGVAPWNVQQYDFEGSPDAVSGRELASGASFDLVFYHYHGFKYAVSNAYQPSEAYLLSENDMRYIYRPYVRALYTAAQEIKKSGCRQVFHECLVIPRIRVSLRRMFNLYIRGKFKKFYHQSYFLGAWHIRSI